MPTTRAVFTASCCLWASLVFADPAEGELKMNVVRGGGGGRGAGGGLGAPKTQGPTAMVAVDVLLPFESQGPDEVRQIRGMTPAFGRCYDAARKKSPKLSGDLTYSATLDLKATPVEPSFEGTLTNEALRACIEKAFAQRSWAKPSAPVTLKVRLRFSMRP